MTRGKHQREKKRAEKRNQCAARGAAIMEDQGTAKDKGTASTHTADKAANNPHSTRWENFKEYVGGSLFTNQAVALFTFVLACAAIYQFIIMNGQLDQMRRDERAWIKMGAIYFAAYGEVEYLDIFGKHHKTTFCDTFTANNMSVSTKNCSDYGGVDNE